MQGSTKTLLLDGNSLTLEDLYSLRKGNIKIGLTPEAWKNVDAGRKVIDDIIAEKKVVYGVNTGFGHFAKYLVHFYFSSP